MDFMTFFGAPIIYKEGLKAKLESRITGLIAVDYIPLKDCIRVTITNRGFIFKYTVYETSDKINHCVSSDTIANEIFKAYNRQISRTFFKK